MHSIAAISTFILLMILPSSANAAVTQLSRVHSHNDYERTRPLQDALDYKISSVEADVWLRKNELMVSHLRVVFRGDLEDLYLKPLQDRITQQG